MTLLQGRTTYKPFKYQWAYEAAVEQTRMHWMPEEVPLSDDIREWANVLTQDERTLLTNLFKFFTQGDIDVSHGYYDKYIPTLGGHPEVQMMLGAFAAMEGTHVRAYAHLVDSLNMPDTMYEEFRNYKEMLAKHDYFDRYPMDTPANIARNIAIFSAFGEGMQLFSSFAVLMNFPRNGKMKGMGQIVRWSQRDETLHTISMIRLFREFISENYEVWTEEFKQDIYQITREMVQLEDDFIDMMFGTNEVISGLSKTDVKAYIRCIADRRLIQLGLRGIFKQKDHPLTWLDEELNAVEHANFFEVRVTEYSKVSMKGDWGKDVWA